jgi:hypothetical protein
MKTEKRKNFIVKKNSLICHIYKTEIPETDWEQTPASVKGAQREGGGYRKIEEVSKKFR